MAFWYYFIYFVRSSIYRNFEGISTWSEVKLYCTGGERDWKKFRKRSTCLDLVEENHFCCLMTTSAAAARLCKSQSSYLHVLRHERKMDLFKNEKCILSLCCGCSGKNRLLLSLTACIVFSFWTNGKNAVLGASMRGWLPVFI